MQHMLPTWNEPDIAAVPVIQVQLFALPPQPNAQTYASFVI